MGLTGGDVEFIIDRVEWLEGDRAILAIAAIAVFGFTLLTIFAATLRSSQRSGKGSPVLARAIRRPNPTSGHRTAGDAGCAASEIVDDGPFSQRRSRSMRRLARLRGRVRRSPLAQGRFLFLSRFASGPLKIGSIAPSSRGLGRAMAAQLPEAFEVCVELGGGTGSLTRSLLAAGVPAAKLIVVERDRRLAAYLRRKFPGVQVIEGDAERLTSLLRAHGIAAVDAIISSLPLRTMPRGVRRRIVSESFAALGDEGLFVQYTYGLGAPVPDEISSDLALEGSRATRIWKNIPPAAVWRYRRAA